MYSKWSSLKMTPVCEGIFKIWPLGKELWDKMLNFDDNIGFTQWCYSENSGQKVQPTFNMDLELELTPLPSQWAQERHKWDQRGAPVNPKFRSKSTSQISIWSWISIQSWTSKNWPQFGTHMVIITLDDSICKKCIISTSDTFIWHTSEKVIKRQSSGQTMELTCNTE